jgi:protein PhnA
MSLEQELHDRSGSACELCTATESLLVYAVPPKSGESVEENVLICETCHSQIEQPEQVEANHWRCLNDSMWSPVPAVQVLAWRMLNRLRGEGWPVDLLEMMYLEPGTLVWAKALGEASEQAAAVIHLDSNGGQLQAGDTVVLIKDLNVKGANFTAKRGTAVRNISLVWDNAEQIEGRVNGQQIVILTQFVKKS